MSIISQLFEGINNFPKKPKPLKPKPDPTKPNPPKNSSGEVLVATPPVTPQAVDNITRLPTKSPEQIPESPTEYLTPKTSFEKSGGINALDTPPKSGDPIKPVPVTKNNPSDWVDKDNPNWVGLSYSEPLNGHTRSTAKRLDAPANSERENRRQVANDKGIKSGELRRQNGGVKR